MQQQQPHQAVNGDGSIPAVPPVVAPEIHTSVILTPAIRTTPGREGSHENEPVPELALPPAQGLYALVGGAGMQLVWG